MSRYEQVPTEVLAKAHARSTNARQRADIGAELERRGAVLNILDARATPPTLEELTRELERTQHTQRLLQDNLIQTRSVIAMVRAMIGELFGPVASIESEEATLRRGPEPRHDGEAIIEALQRVSDRLSHLESMREDRG